MAADPRPANDSAPIRPSLFDRAIGAARAPRTPAAPTPPAELPPRRAIDRSALALAAAIVATPLLTWGGALWFAADARGDARVLARTAAPALAARSAQDRAAPLLAQAWTGPTLGSTIEAIARLLPGDAALLRVERRPGGALSLEIAAPDPDRALAALRRDPVLAGLRAASQAPGDDGRMRIVLEERR